MKSYLSPEALERLNNVKSVNPVKAEAVENIVIANVSQGKING